MITGLIIIKTLERTDSSPITSFQNILQRYSSPQCIGRPSKFNQIHASKIFPMVGMGRKIMYFWGGITMSHIVIMGVLE